VLPCVLTVDVHKSAAFSSAFIYKSLARLHTSLGFIKTKLRGVDHVNESSRSVHQSSSFVCVLGDRYSEYEMRSSPPSREL